MKIGKGIFAVLSIAVIFACAVMIYNSYCGDLFSEITSKNPDVSAEDSIPENIPLIDWDTDEPEKSYEELSGYLSELEPQIAIRGTDQNLEWEDICKENFWVEGFKISSIAGSKTKTYMFEYKEDAGKNKEMQAEIEKEVQDIISVIPDGSDDWEKTLILHDELIKRITFDKKDENKHSHDIYGALAEHKAVCQGYTYSMTYLLERLGLKGYEIYSDTHIWNKLPYYNSGECYADITWDDIDKFDKNGEPYIIHDYFGLLKSEMEKLSEHHPEKKQTDSSNALITGDNYHRKKGCFIEKDDNASLELSVKEQYDSGRNLIELRFADENDYKEAGDKVEDILRRNGYSGAYLSWSNESLLTYAVGLNP